MSEFWLQRADKSHWEKVDEFTFVNWQNALICQGEDKPRYNGNRVSRSAEGVHISCVNLTNKDYAIIARFLAITEKDCPFSVPGGFVKSPDFIKFKRGKGVVLREIGKETYKAA